MRRGRRIQLLLASAALASTVGCAPAGDPADDTLACDRCDGFDSAAPLEVVPGPQLLRCALEPSAGGQLLACVYEPPGEGYPFAISELTVAAVKTPADPRVVIDTFGSATFGEAGRREVVSIAAGEYPVLVQVSMHLSSAVEGLVRTNREDDLSFLSTSWRIERPGAESRIYAVPVDLWPVELEVPEGARLSGDLEPYELPLAPWQTFMDGDRPTRTATLPRIGPEASVVGTWLAVAPGAASLAGTAEICVAGGCGTTGFVLDGPGRYRADGEGFRRVDRPTGPEGPGDGGVEPGDGDGGPGDDEPAPPEPVDDGCGGEGQPRCVVGGESVCDDGFVYLTTDYRCHECGGEGQPRCVVGGESVCDDGFVYLTTDYRCHECGGEGQPRCVVGGESVCDDGFVYLTTDYRCHECGGEGQPRCVVGGESVCDEGFVYLTTDYRCHECGGEGQPRCFVGGAYVCDDGFVYSSSDGRCHAAR